MLNRKKIILLKKEIEEIKRKRNEEKKFEAKIMFFLPTVVMLILLIIKNLFHYHLNVPETILAFIIAPCVFLFGYFIENYITNKKIKNKEKLIALYSIGT